MLLLNFSVLRPLLRYRTLCYGRLLRLECRERSVCGGLLGEAVICRRQILTSCFYQKSLSTGQPDSLEKEKAAKEQNSDHTDESVPLIVRLLHQNRAQKKQKESQSQSLSIDQLQKTLEDIKWDTDARIQKHNVDEFSQNAEEETEAADSEDYARDTDLSEMISIEDIFLDDDVPQARTTHPRKKRRQKVKGTPDPTIPVSDVPCSGCGAMLHCQDPIIPGYLPSEKFKCLTREDMRMSMCQRCFLIQAYNMFLNVRVSAETYPQIIQKIKHSKALVMVVVDLFDMKNSVYKDLLKYIGTNRPLFIVGNKVDMIPMDSPRYLERTKQALLEVCEAAGLNPTGKNIRHVCLVSAKTGYGIENLVTKLMISWQLKGHVYVVGSTNVGKSTLFNALLMSDYCKSVARGFINRATVSVWPGTTLNLVKFPIVNPAPWRLALRSKRLMKDEKKFATEELVRKLRLSELGSFKAAVLTGHVGLTDFRSAKKIAEDAAMANELMSGQEVNSFSQDKEGFVQEISGRHRLGPGPKGDDYNPDALQMYWCNDTPGVVNLQQIINLLEPEELVTILPKTRVQPQCVTIKPGQVLFVTGMGRIDYVQGNTSIYLTAHVAHTIKLHVKDRDEADDFYIENIGTAALGVPIGDEKRLSRIPALIGREYQIIGTGWDIAAADIQLSSLGWVSVAAGQRMPVTLRAYTPGGKGLHLRSPALLPNFTQFRGKRKGKTPYYRLGKAVL